MSAAAPNKESSGRVGNTDMPIQHHGLEIAALRSVQLVPTAPAFAPTAVEADEPQGVGVMDSAWK